MEIIARHHEPIYAESVRIKIHGKEYKFAEKADGLHIVEITDDCIMIQPYMANHIVIATKTIKTNQHEGI